MFMILPAGFHLGWVWIAVDGKGFHAATVQVTLQRWTSQTRITIKRMASNAPLKVPLAAPSESLPERPGAPDCPYFLKTQRCKFGLKCKFNHPKDKLATAGASENGDVNALPERPSEPPCAVRYLSHTFVMCIIYL
ncbi:PREDICTED: zinc finger CCCH domain-containing protein 43-like [Fragaria vesca subsp. vesca]